MDLEVYDFFNKLEPKAKDYLKMRLQPVEVPKDTILFFQGDTCDSILFLTSGKVRLYIQSEEADEITLYNLNAGEQCIVNTASTLSETPAIATAIATTDIEGYVLDIYSLKDLTKLSDVYQSYLFSLYTLRIDDLVKLVNDIKFKKLDTRVLDWLYRQDTRNIEITHEELANILGSSRVAVSKILKSLENDGSIKLHRGSIELL